MSGAVRALLAGLVDYAGLFPPAGLPMEETAANYAAYHRSHERWMLSRLVAPSARLAELAAAVGGLPAAMRGAGPWEVSALVGTDTTADVRAALAVEAAHGSLLAVRSFETRAGSVTRVAELRALVPSRCELYCELPLGVDLPALLSGVRSAGARAKIRAGGVVATDIPSTDAVLAFLEACLVERVSFKATAGLHHPVRGPAPLTYEPGSARATMFGHLNVVLAAAALWAGRDREEARALLEETDRAGLAFEADAVRWGGSRLTSAELAAARRDFVLAIGSCSFSEPVAELRDLGAELDGAATEGA